MLLMIDNYDSFTYNIVQYFGELNQEVKVVRNDQVTLEDIERWQPKYLVIGPGPCSPSEAGISIPAINHFAGKFDENLPVYLKEINISLIEYIEAFALSALIQGLTTAFVYLVIGHPNWILLGIFSAISSVIPYVGPIVANLLGIVTSITMGATKLIILFVLIFIQSNVVPYVIQPKIYSSKIDLSIMWVLFGILTGSTLFGAWGMIIAMPILVTIKISYRVYRQHNPQPKNA